MLAVPEIINCEQLLRHFHHAVTSLVRRTSDLQDAYRSMLIVLAARKSREEGRRISPEL